MRAGRPWNATRSWAIRIQRHSAALSANISSASAIGRRDIVGIARQRGPAERSFAEAEERPDVFRHEPGNLEGVAHAGLLGLGADVVAVVERDRAGALEREHRAHVLRHRRHRSRDVVRPDRSAAADSASASGQPRGHVPVQRVVRGRLIGQHVRHDAAADELRQDLGGVALERDRPRGAFAAPPVRPRQRVVEARRRARRRTASRAAARCGPDRRRRRARRRRSS